MKTSLELKCVRQLMCCCSLLSLCMLTSVATASDRVEPRQHQIMKPINNLFDGMRESDGNKVRDAFSENAVMHRAHAQLKTGGTPEKFAQAVESSSGPIWDEKIWDIEIKVEDKLASVWTKFAFFLGDKLSHCGINSFQLYHFEDGWKIIYLADTFENQHCEVPEEVR